MKKNLLTTILIVVTAVAVLAAGGIYLLKSGNLGGGSANQADKAVLEGGVQTVESKLTTSGYPDLVVQEGVPVRWNLYAAPGTLTSCNNAIIIPEYGIEAALQEGDNIIEFTPQKTGTIAYSCWMGMINADILVVSDLSKVSDASADRALAKVQGSRTGGGGCCSTPGN